MVDESRWRSFRNVYGTPYDPREVLERLLDNRSRAEAWEELWDNLYHQGSVVEASFAVVHELAKMREQLGADWNLYGLAGSIEVVRLKGKAPSLSRQDLNDYLGSIHNIAQAGLRVLPSANDHGLIVSILGLLALWKGQATLGELALDFTEDERLELMSG